MTAINHDTLRDQVFAIANLDAERVRALDRARKPNQRNPMKATTEQIANSLRALANWIDKHEFHGESIVILSIDGWGDVDVHLSPKSFACRTGEPLRDDGHGIAVFDGVKVVTFDKELAERQGERLEVEAGNRGTT